MKYIRSENYIFGEYSLRIEMNIKNVCRLLIIVVYRGSVRKRNLQAFTFIVYCIFVNINFLIGVDNTDLISFIGLYFLSELRKTSA